MQANIEYIQKLQQQEHEEVLRQEELDRITAQELQQQEMSYLGICRSISDQLFYRHSFFLFFMNFIMSVVAKFA